MGKLIGGMYWFTSDLIEQIDSRNDWTDSVLVMVKGHCGPHDSRPVWITRKVAADLLFPPQEN